MTAFLTVGAAAFLASALTLFSGFGLGTLLLPAFALFFPVPEAVTLTALVHLANNLFKLALLGRHADRAVVLRFGLPSVAGAFLGAWTLLSLSGIAPLAHWSWGGRQFAVLPVNLAVSILMLGFALAELAPPPSMPPRWLPAGGLLSGFFGGLSGHQGALRSAFLLRAGLGKEAFLGTGVVIACLVDLARLPVYLSAGRWGASPSLLAWACLCAFAGSWLAARSLPKVTMRGVRLSAAALLLAIALALGSGILG